MPIPKIPAKAPVMNVSALNTFEILCFEAPIARRIPISFCLSSTEIYVMTPIIMEDTTSEIATKAINTYEMTFTISVTDVINVPTRSVYVMTLSSSAFFISSLYASSMLMISLLLSKSFG